MAKIFAFVIKLALLHSIYIGWIVTVPALESYCIILVIIYGMVFVRTYAEWANPASGDDLLGFANQRASQTLRLLLILAMIYLFTYALDRTSGIPFMGICVLPTEIASGSILAIMCPILFGMGLAMEDKLSQSSTMSHK